MARDEQEDQVDQHQGRARGQGLERRRDTLQVLRKVDLGDQGVGGGRDLHPQLAPNPGQQAVQLRRVGDQLGDEGPGVVGHHIGRDPEHQGRDHQGQGKGRVPGEMGNAPPEHASQPVDDHHQEQGEGEGRQDPPQPPDHRPDHHHGDQHRGRAGGVIGDWLLHLPWALRAWGCPMLSGSPFSDSSTATQRVVGN